MFSNMNFSVFNFKEVRFLLGLVAISGPASISIIFGGAILRTGTDYDIIGLLKAGEYYTSILNPLSGVILTELYQSFSFVPWYSLLLLVVLYMNVFLVYVYIFKNSEGLCRVALLLILALVFLKLTYILSITILTGLSFAVAILHVNNGSSRYFIIAIILASLLRAHLSLLFLPPIILTMFGLWLVSSITVKTITRSILILALPFSMTVLDTYIMKTDKYNGWEEKRSISINIDHDLRKYGVVNDEQYFLAKKGLLWDEAFYSDVDQESSPSISTIYFEGLADKLASLDFKNQNYTVTLMLFVILLLTISPVRIRGKKSIVVVCMFISITAYVVIVIQSRDVMRTTLPLIAILVFSTIRLYLPDIRVKDKDNYIAYTRIRVALAMLACVYFVGIVKDDTALHLKRVAHNNDLVDNVSQVIVKYKDKNIILDGYPLKGLYPSYTFLKERQNLSRNFDGNVMRNGWVSGHPFLDNKMQVFLGSTGSGIDDFRDNNDTFLVGVGKYSDKEIDKFMEMLDRYYPHFDLEHRFRVVEKYKNVIVGKIYLSSI